METGYTFKGEDQCLFFIKATNRGVFNLVYSDYWDDKLGENGREVLLRLAADGLIEPAPLDVALDKLFTLEELKPHLKARGIKVGGKKAELIARILAEDRTWVEEQAAKGGKYRRTEFGQAIADKIYEKIGHESGEMEARLHLLIHDRRYDEAFRTWAEWDAGQVFPRDEWQGIDNRKTPSEYFVAMAKRIEARLPAGLRERTILAQLYGRGVTEPDAREALSAAAYERDLLNWIHSSGVVGIQILPPRNVTCRRAMEYAGFYRLMDAPDFPFGSCDLHDSEDACMCWWQAVFDSDRVAEWKTPERRHPLVSGSTAIPSSTTEAPQEPKKSWWRRILNALTDF